MGDGVVHPKELDSAGATPRRRGAGTAALIVVVIAFSFQTGSAVAVKVIDSVGIVEALWLRTAVAALILAVLRPRSLRLPPRGQRLPVAALTLALLGMNASFYAAISNAPVGLVVSIEFLGPLTVAVIGSRRPLDFLWIALAGAGVVLLGGPTSSVSGLGLAFSLLAACFWAAYLLLAKRALRDMDPLPVTTLMLAGSAALLTPVLIATGPHIAGYAGAIALGVLVAVLSSAFPYFLEFVALRLVPASTYGVLLSVEPAIGALTGFLILSQRLTALEIVAMVAVMVAAAGASWTSGAGRELEV
ncbi:MAG: EamA family transporter, partial [Actinobacteria bacterium]|nr:EamA family transporter [Actinomycetota bacterium]